MRIKKWLAMNIAGVVFLVSMVQSHAITDEEYEVLTELSYAIDNLYPIILKGKHKQAEKDRIYFNWDKAWDELSIIQQGVLESFESINMQPRAIKPLEGDYLK